MLYVLVRYGVRFLLQYCFINVSKLDITHYPTSLCPTSMFHLASSVSRRLALQLLASQVPRRITASCWGIQSQSPIVGPIHLQLYSTTQSPYTTRYAFAFDIDGVLVRGKRVLQQAIAALDKLYHPPPPGATVPIQRVPFVFLTNGGGVLESTKVCFWGEKIPSADAFVKGVDTLNMLM